MAEALDMSLDDLIKNNKKSSGSSRGRGGRGRGRGGSRDSARGFGSGPGPTRRTPKLGPNRVTPYFLPQAVHVQELLITGNSDSEAGTKLYISNLDYGVTNEDIKVLFSEIGELRRYSIHYDRSGRSKGTAEVVFVRQSDALAAMKRYNNVQLDGVPMKLELVGVKVVAPVALPTTNQGILGRTPGNVSRSRQERTAGRGQERGGSGGYRGLSRGQDRGGGGGAPQSHGTSSSRGRGRGKGIGGKVSAEDLDAELDKYHLEAMQIN